MSRIAVATALLAVSAAHAEVRGVVRFGMLPIELEASRDTPLFGDDIDRAVRSYNQAAEAYDRRFGGNTARIDAGDLGVDDTLATFAPGVELGGDVVFFRIEAVLGVGDDVHSYGIGIYPLNLQARLSRELAAYVSAGGSASWLSSDDQGGGVGGLVTARAAGGVRISERVAVEVGYSAYALGGVVDHERLADYEPTPDAPPPSPSSVVAAGEARGLVDLSVGIVF